MRDFKRWDKNYRDTCRVLSLSRCVFWARYPPTRPGTSKRSGPEMTSFHTSSWSLEPVAAHSPMVARTARWVTREVWCRSRLSLSDVFPRVTKMMIPIDGDAMMVDSN